MIFGAVLIAGGVGVAAVMVVGMLFFELLINMFAVVFTKDLRWYGPSLLDSDPGIRNGVLAATALGSILLVAGAVRRYGAETPPLPSGPPLPPAGPPAV
jgi:hypothetical protein